MRHGSVFLNHCYGVLQMVMKPICCVHSHNKVNWPVLKHGPRSLTLVRVCGFMKSRCVAKAKSGTSLYRDCTIAQTWSLVMDLRCSISAGTRKMVNYAWIRWSQRKLWWKLVAILTCKSIVKFGYRGERLIEPSSSWFPPKFPSG